MSKIFLGRFLRRKMLNLEVSWMMMMGKGKEMWMIMGKEIWEKAKKYVKQMGMQFSQMASLHPEQQ